MTIYQQQCLLAYLGYSPGVIDGIYGNVTRNAIKQFQTDNSLPVTGTADEATEKMLRNNVAVGTLKRADNVASDSKTEKVGTSGTFWDSIKYFKREEFRCPCGKCNGFPVEPQEGIVKAAETLRIALGVPMTIVPPDGHSGGSGVRCREYNATFPNSVSDSRHLDGKAIDFSACGASSAKIESQLEKMRNSKILRYWYKISSTSYHMDIT